MREKEILKSKRYRFLLHKQFFSTGQAILSEFKIQYLIVALAVADLTSSLWGILSFGIGSYIIGRVWYSKIKKVTLAEVSAEVGNQFNKFQQEMRREYKKQ